MACLLVFSITAMADQYKNFRTSIYTPVSVVNRLADPEIRERTWQTISSQMKVDKIYIESHRDRVVADDQLLAELKEFFTSKGLEVAGGITYSDSHNTRQFQSFCYTNPDDRALIKQVAELTAKHFDEIILDDFFFVTTKHPSDIEAKGERSWTEFRLELLQEAARSLIIDPAKAVNPNARVIVKYPNWYEHFHGLGFDLDQGPKIFDGIYTGTETRDPEVTDQFLQQYESYQILRYFENIKPGGNGGGWVDTYATRYLDRYPEQLWDTLFAKPREITLYNYWEMLGEITAGEREEWAELPTSFNLETLLSNYKEHASNDAPEPTMALVAGKALEQVDAFLDKLGNPIGIKSYRPYHAEGEDFLHNYFGMLGLPIDLYPTFPEDADVILLTEAAKADPEIVQKIKTQLLDGKSVVITSGLLRALQDRGIDDIVELEYTERRIVADGYNSGYGFGDRDESRDLDQSVTVLYPQIRFFTNDAWALASVTGDGGGSPLFLMDRYGKSGLLFVWTMPDNFRHLYRLPAEVLGLIKNTLMKDIFARVDGPTQVALFAYDNDTFIVQSFLPNPTEVTIGLTGDFTKIRNIETGEILKGTPPIPSEQGHRANVDDSRTTFQVKVLPHSYLVFAAEK